MSRGATPTVASALRNGGRSSWTVRRRVVVSTLVGCWVVIGWAMLGPEDSRVGETAIISAFGLLGAVIGAYVFGAAWEDVRSRDAEALAGRDYPDPANPPRVP